MPSKARKPIDYTPAAGGAMFRPQDQVDAELAVVEDEHDTPEPAASERTATRRKRMNERTNARTVVPSIDAPVVASTVAPVFPLIDEPKIRHSFDITRRQLDALYDLQDQRRRATGKKPKMGELVSEALDLFIRQNEG